MRLVTETEKVSSTVTEKTKSLKLPKRLRNLSTTYSDVEHVGKPPEKLKSHDDDHAEHLRCGGDWCGMSMQNNGEYCMHKMYRRYIYTVQRRDVLLLLLEIAMVVVGEGDSCVKKEESAVAKLNKRGTVQ